MMNEVGDKSLLKKYLQGYIAFKTGHSTDAIAFLSAAPQTAEYVALPSINYWLGNAKLCRMDNDTDDHLLKFIRDNRSPNFIKDAYLKLAYFELMRGNESGYNNYLKLVKQKGNVNNEKDKQALKEANDAMPDTELLRSRFYFDGGYYSNALTLLKKKNVNDLKLLRDKIELYYRLGRTYDKMNNATEALVNYQKAITIGRNASYYYAANSALLSGLIYEQKHDVKKAAEYFKTALKMENHEYQNSIDTQAEEGLKRIKAN
jgi:tetratricopeptide (TPR) repeat protein